MISIIVILNNFTVYTQNSPYGYWISHDDIIPVVDEENHVEIAIEKVLKRSTKAVSVYAVMFRLGFVRVTNYKSGGYGVEYWCKAKLSKLQKEFIKDAENIDSVDYAHITKNSNCMYVFMR